MTGNVRGWPTWITAACLCACGVTLVVWFARRGGALAPSRRLESPPTETPGDFIAKADARYSQGVTAENNAAVLLLRAIGPDLLPEAIRRHAFERLGIPPLPARGDYFIPLADYVKATAPKEELTPRPPTTLPGEGGWDSYKDVWGAELTKDLERFSTLFLDPNAPGRSQAQERAEGEFEEALGRPWSPEELPTIAGWLRANEKPLDLAVAATRRPNCYFPLLSTDDPPTMENVQKPDNKKIRYRAVHPLRARAMLKLGRGDARGALADLSAVYRLSRLITRSPLPVQTLVGTSIQDSAWRTTVSMAKSRRLSADQARILLGELEQLTDWRWPPSVVAWERQCLLESLLGAPGPARERPDNSGGDGAGPANATAPPAVRQTARAITALYEILLEAEREQTFAGRRNAYAAVEQDLFGPRGENETPEAIAMRLLDLMVARKKDPGMGLEPLKPVDARLYLRMTVQAADLLSVHFDECRMKLDLAKIALALAAFRADNGRYPDRLGELAGGYLGVLPADLFVYEPLRYRREGAGYLLYSVGQNMKDDGGVWGAADRGDIVVRAK